MKICKSRNNNKYFFSFLIITYNQERYIKSTLQSVLNQNYKNYEIVVSDDCSIDSTWKIINDFSKNFKDKKINFILNRNSTNLGIFRNFQKSIKLSKGEWLIAMAGDDISKPNRLKTIEQLIDVDSNIYAIGTGYDLINKHGYYISKNNKCIQKSITLPLYPGFSAAIHRDTYTKFPIVKKNIQSEDIIFTIRALELGKVLLSDISTINHRIHSNNITSKGKSPKAYNGKILNLKNAIKTLEYCKISENKNNVSILSLIEYQINFFKIKIEDYKNIISFNDKSFFQKVLWIKNSKDSYTKNKIKIFLESFKITRYISKSLYPIYNLIFNNKKIKASYKIYEL